MRGADFLIFSHRLARGDTIKAVAGRLIHKERLASVVPPYNIIIA